MKDTFIIEVDKVRGEVDYKNPDNLTFFEVLGAIEFTKMMITKRYLDELEED